MDFDPRDLGVDVDALIQQFGLGRHADRIRAALRPTTYLMWDAEGVGPRGGSRAGGVPDLPVDAPWPLDASDQAMQFGYQVDLAQVPAAARGPLPAAGLLSLFVGLDEPASDVEHRVQLFPPGLPLAPRTPPADAEPATDMMDGTRPGTLRLVSRPDLPRWATTDADAMEEGLTEDELAGYAQLKDALLPSGWGEGRCVGRLLGHSAGIGVDPREDAVMMRDLDRDTRRRPDAYRLITPERVAAWHHLLSLETCNALELNIWDAGYLEVLITADALAAVDLTDTYAGVQSS